MPAAPMLAAVAVMEMANSCPMEGFMSFTLARKILQHFTVARCWTVDTWAMKMAAMASYRAVPSMLMVAPMGRMNLNTAHGASSIT